MFAAHFLLKECKLSCERAMLTMGKCITKYFILIAEICEQFMTVVGHTHWLFTCTTCDRM